MSTVPAYPVDPRVQLGPRIRQFRARYGDADPRTIEARQQLAAAQIGIEIGKRLADDIRLTDAQVAELTAALRGGRGSGAEGG